MKNTFSFFCVLFVWLWVGCTAQTSKSSSEVKLLLPTDFQKALKETATPQLVDIRTPEEFQAGYIEHAQNIDWYQPDFMQKMEGKDKAQPVYIYCARGGRSKSAAAKLSAAGYKIYELQGGFDEWKTAQLPQMK